MAIPSLPPDVLLGEIRYVCHDDISDDTAVCEQVTFNLRSHTSSSDIRQLTDILESIDQDQYVNFLHTFMVIFLILCFIL